MDGLTASMLFETLGDSVEGGALEDLLNGVPYQARSWDTPRVAVKKLTEGNDQYSERVLHEVVTQVAGTPSASPGASS